MGLEETVKFFKAEIGEGLAAREAGSERWTGKRCLACLGKVHDPGVQGPVGGGQWWEMRMKG